MSSSSEGALYELSVQQDIPPAPNGGPQCADWLPRFAGSSWLAYGASTTVVIATALAPSNPGEATAGRFFQQVRHQFVSIVLVYGNFVCQILEFFDTRVET